MAKRLMKQQQMELTRIGKEVILAAILGRIDVARIQRVHYHGP